MIKLNNTYYPLTYPHLQGEDKGQISTLNDYPLPHALPFGEDNGSYDDKSAYPRHDPRRGDRDDRNLMIGSAYPFHEQTNNVHEIVVDCFKNDDNVTLTWTLFLL